MLMITVDRSIVTKDTGSIIRMNGIGVVVKLIAFKSTFK